jgi:PAS domain S-box-containing protein
MSKTRPVFRYTVAILAAPMALYLRYQLTPLLGNGNPYHTVWLAVVFSSWYCGLGPSILTTVLGALGVWWWFLPPVHSWTIHDRADVFGIFGFLLFSSAIIALGESNRRGFAARSKLAAIVESSDDAVVTKNLSGVVTSWNKGAERVFGYTAEEAVGQHITLIIPVDRQEEETEILARLRRGERIDHFETVRKRKDGSLLDISVTISPLKDASGRVIGASKIARDVTERKEAQRAAAMLAAIVDSSDDAIISKNLDGIITSWNRSAERLFGYSAEEAIGQNIRLIVPRDRQHEEATILERLGRGERIDHFETVRVRKDGSMLDISLTISPVKDAAGRVIGASKVARDITHRKEAEKAIKEKELSSRLLKLQDEERRRMARELHDGVGQLLAAMSMNAVMINMEKSKLSPDTAECAEDNSRLIEQASTDIRTMSYLFHPPLLDEMGLHSALKWYVEGFAERSKVTTELELPTDQERLPQDYELCLFRITQECLTNIHRHSGSSTALVRLLRPPGEIKLEVSDEGRGLDQETQSKIAAGESVGVGFRGMRERVRHLGGNVEVRSNEKGTSVIATLPFAESDRSLASSSSDDGRGVR